MSNSKDISIKLDKLYNYINKFTTDNGFPPSVRGICKDLRIKSTATAYYYLKKLEENGRIVKSPSKNRAIDVPLRSATKTIPLLGRIAAGTPILAIENIEEQYTLPVDLLPSGDCFVLTVSGNSMVESGIYNGDKIIVRQQNTAENGQIVAALIDDSATVKRFFKEKDHVRLHPENSAMKDIIVDDVVILGIVTGLIRRFNQ